MHALFAEQVQKCRSADGSIDLGLLAAQVSAIYAARDAERSRCQSVGSCPLSVEAGLQAAIDARSAELAVAESTIDALLSNVDQGIVMIDGDGRVAVFNHRFVEFSGLQLRDFDGRPNFSDLVQKMVANGEFSGMSAEFQRWASEFALKPGSHVFERTRPDGTVLSVQTRRMSNGGEVRVLSNITDLTRRRQEVESIRRKLEETIENVAQGILKISADKRIEFFNSRVIELLGLPDDLLCPGRPFADMLEYQIAAGEFDPMGPDFLTFIRSGLVHLTDQSYERRRPDGTILDVRTVVLPDGGAVRTFTDVTQARQREWRLERAEAEFRSLFENSIVGVYRSTLDGRHLRANPAFARLNGFDSEAELLGYARRNPRDWYVVPGRREEFSATMAREGRMTDFVSEVYRLKTGEKLWVSEAAWLVRDCDGQPLYYEGMVIDATDRRKAESKIEHLALHDQLTGLPNRALFLDRLTQTVAARCKTLELAVLCIDLDRFKDVNDSKGHDVGDILLRIAARRLSKAVNALGLAARFGGDEFAVILPEIRDRDTLVQVAHRIVRTLSKPYRIRGKRLEVGASVGVAISPSDGSDATELLKKADIALYRAKRDGRGTFAFFDQGMTEALLARRDLEQDLRRAIQKNEFVLFYQPIIDLEHNTPVAYEALIRWQHPEKGLTAPAHFIDIAEESGLILQIGEIALREACATFAKLPGEVQVSVNLSPVQFRNPQFAVSVINALAITGLSPRRLTLEITETVLLSDDARTLETLRQLRQLGVQIALDDFGIGHSSLSYIQKFPFDKIKIDRSFVRDSDKGMMNMAIRRAILGLGQDISVDVVVEGVETTQQRDMLIFEGARFAQGYLFGKPEPTSVLFGDIIPAGETLRVA